MLKAVINKESDGSKVEVEIGGYAEEVVDDLCNLIRVVHTILHKESPDAAQYVRDAMRQIISKDEVWEIVEVVHEK